MAAERTADGRAEALGPGRSELTRREALATLGGALAAGVSLAAQAKQGPQKPPSVVSNPPRDFGPDATTTYFNDPDVLTVDPAFGGLVQANASISGSGPARSGPKARRGTARDAIWSSATYRRTVSSAGSKTTAVCRCSAARRITATATRYDQQGRQVCAST